MKGDAAIDRAADRLQRKADELAPQGGAKAKLAASLSDDADFLRKLKPSLVKARAKAEAPTSQKPGDPPAGPPGVTGAGSPQPAGVVRSTPASKPNPVPQMKRAKKGKGGGPSPWLVLGVALFTGIVLAKAIDWRGHAHPRD